MSEVTVNGLTANYSFDGEAISIYSPKIVGGERIIIVDGRVPENRATSGERVAALSYIVGFATNEIDVDQSQKKIAPITTSYHPALFGSLAFGYVVG